MAGVLRQEEAAVERSNASGGESSMGQTDNALPMSPLADLADLADLAEPSRRPLALPEPLTWAATVDPRG